MKSETERQGARVVFVIGGARSGKSTYALAEGNKTGGRKAYIATAKSLDEEMIERISRHKKERDVSWDTYEEPVKLAEVIRRIRSHYQSIIIDCLTIWLSNIMIHGSEFDQRTVRNRLKGLIGALWECKKSTKTLSRIYIVSNEIGMGIVPENRLSRQFRDIIGRLNQEVANVADEVYFLISGIPLKVK